MDTEWKPLVSSAGLTVAILALNSNYKLQTHQRGEEEVGVHSADWTSCIECYNVPGLLQIFWPLKSGRSYLSAMLTLAL